MRSVLLGAVVLALAAGVVACGSADTAAQLADQEARIAELEAQLSAATSTTSTTTTTAPATTTGPTTTTLPRAYVEASNACRVARDALTEIRDQALALEYERNDWTQRRNDYLAGRIAVQDEVAESALAAVRASDLRRLSLRLAGLSYPSAFDDYAMDLGLFVDALARDSDLEAELVLMSPSPYQSDLIDQANVAMNEWIEYESRITGEAATRTHQDCLEAAWPLRSGCDNCLTG